MCTKGQHDQLDRQLVQHEPGEVQISLMQERLRKCPNLISRVIVSVNLFREFIFTFFSFFRVKKMMTQFVPCNRKLTR